jgi:hypothetical protein
MDARLSSRLPSVDVAGAQDGSWARLCFTLLFLAGNPSYMGADVDGIASLLHHRTVCG